MSADWKDCPRCHGAIAPDALESGLIGCDNCGVEYKADPEFHAAVVAWWVEENAKNEKRAQS